MKLRTIYWIITGIFAAFLTFGSIFNVLSVPQAVELIVNKLGFPPFMVPFVGVMKILGCIAILVPGFPRIKEWAYAGLAYDLGGAVIAHIAIGAPFGEWAGLFLPITFLAASYLLYHKTKPSQITS
jgi:uncharacterized membrane protein YphA (DoxX/SURF4 family)